MYIKDYLLFYTVGPHTFDKLLTLTLLSIVKSASFNKNILLYVIYICPIRTLEYISFLHHPKFYEI